MTSEDPKLTRKMAIIGIAVTLFLLQFWWLVSDREPTSSEMTWAYRKHAVAANENADLKEMAALRQRLYLTELKKQRCEKLERKRYRCEASVEVVDQPINKRHEAEKAIYSHNPKGWSFGAIGGDSPSGTSVR